MPVFGERAHHVEHLADELGVERGGRLVEEHELRVHRQGARDRHALLLPARELGRIGRHLVSEADPVEQLAPAGDASDFGTFLTLIGASITF